MIIGLAALANCIMKKFTLLGQCEIKTIFSGATTRFCPFTFACWLVVVSAPQLRFAYASPDLINFLSLLEAARVVMPVFLI